MRVGSLTFGIIEEENPRDQKPKKAMDIEKCHAVHRVIPYDRETMKGFWTLTKCRYSVYG
jgi:hypothetical protein